MGKKGMAEPSGKCNQRLVGQNWCKDVTPLTCSLLVSAPPEGSTSESVLFSAQSTTWVHGVIKHERLQSKCV